MMPESGLLSAEDELSMTIDKHMRKFRSCSPALYFCGRFFFKHILGIALKCFFLSLICEVFFFVYAIAVPFEALYKPMWLLCVLGAFGLYMFPCTILYFFRASLTPPGSPAKVSRKLG
uniref:Palmitoyltransferase n=1 Tax=Steinernema glaseri TaxID=37863 RepID=A0A1I7Z6U7_9BILA